jgi:hypothetical protein
MNPTPLGALLCLACIGVANAQSLTHNSSTQQTLRFTGSAPHTLEVRAITGAIAIEAYDGRDVEMMINRSVSAATEDGLRAAERDVVLDTSDNAARIQAIVRHADMGVCGDDPVWSERRLGPRYKVRYDFTIRVPRNTRLELCSINKADITVSGTREDFTIRSVNGRITLTDMGGSGEAATINGRVTASFVSAPRSPSLFKSINGDVVLTMPDRLAATLRMKSFNGGLFTDYEVQSMPAPKLVAAERRDGMYVYRSTDFTTVSVGGGGPELTLETMNGDVRVLRRSQ